MGKVHRSAAERGRLVEEYKASGLSAMVFASREGIPVSTLYGWLSGPGRRPVKLRLARVVRCATMNTAAGAEQVESPAVVVIELGAARVHVPPGIDRATLAAVLDELQSPRRGRS
jgi:predicted transcriptional regulator